jgi:hypothetical protein
LHRDIFDEAFRPFTIVAILMLNSIVSEKGISIEIIDEFEIIPLCAHCSQTDLHACGDLNDITIRQIFFVKKNGLSQS